jgi:exodeoxyribonuclease VII small subunit
MSDAGDEDFEVRLIEVEETAQATAAAPTDDTRGMSAAPTDDIQGMSAAPTDDIQEMSYEQARDALVGVVDRLERGGSTLEESLALWERGEALAARCETWLIGARARLDAARGTAPVDA